MVDLPEIRGYVNKGHVEAHRAHGSQPDQAENCAPFGEGLAYRRRSSGLVPLRPSLLDHMSTNVKARNVDRDPDQKRDAPAPAVHHRPVEHGRHQSAKGRSQENAAAGANLSKTSEKPAMPGSRMFDEKYRRDRILSANRKSLKQSH